MAKELIDFATFVEVANKLDIRFGTITFIERDPKSTRLLKLLVNFGTEERVVVTNIGSDIEDEQILKYRQFPFVMNLTPTKMMGIESSAMIMVVTHPDGTMQFPPLHTIVPFPNGGQLL